MGGGRPLEEKLHKKASSESSWMQCIMGHHPAVEAGTTCTTWSKKHTHQMALNCILAYSDINTKQWREHHLFDATSLFGAKEI